MPEHRHDLLLALRLAELHEPFREPVVSLEHQAEPHAEEVDPLEDDSSLLGIPFCLSAELLRELGPMPGGLQMMTNVIAVIEAAPIVTAIDARDAVPIRVLRRRLVDESVLRPVAGHHGESRDAVRSH